METGTIVAMLVNDNANWLINDGLYKVGPFEYQSPDSDGRVEIHAYKTAPRRLQLEISGLDESTLLVDIALPVVPANGRLWTMVAWSGGNLRVFVEGQLATEIAYRK